MSVVRARGVVDLASSAKDAWPLLVATDRMNRLLGMDAVSYRPTGKDRHDAARFLADTRMGGFAVTYEEFPYEWEFPKRFGVYRKFVSGPLRFLRMTWELEEKKSGCALAITFEADAKNIVLKPFAWLGGRKAVSGLAELAREIDAHVHAKAPSPFLEPVAPSDRVALAAATLRLKERVRPELADRIAKLVETCPDADALRMRPFEVADEWNEPRREVLAAMLHAVPAGLVELRWAIVCPSCRTASEETSDLGAIGKEGHCQLCDIAFELDLDRAIEATFRPHEKVRQVPVQFFCMGGPARTPHVLTQVIIEPGAKTVVAAPEENGRFRIFARGGARASLEVDGEGDESASAKIETDRIEPADMRTRPRAEITIENKTSDALHVKLERLAYASAAATAAELATLAEFRALFSSDLLKRETPLKVARCAILFSDLTGSTALYTQVGDAAAFRLVDDHFDVLRDAVAKSGGAVVKTMGDAVMAAFSDETACIDAAIECLRRFEEFRKTTKHGERTGIKLGLYSGPCYVVTANGALDYFGSTVNVAARLQHLAASGEIVLERRAAERVKDNASLVTGDPIEVRVKGIDHALEVVHLKLVR